MEQKNQRKILEHPVNGESCMEQRCPDEKKQLKEWLPSLLSSKLDTLSLDQLRVLHFVLGYNSKIASHDEFIDEIEGQGYNTAFGEKIWDILVTGNYFVMEYPYQC